jgi:pimeloyl-ACP methyl ester carboxylesterase
MLKRMRYAQRFRTGRVRSADGTAVAYRAIGSGPPVMVIPGALAVARDFDGFAQLLGARFSVHTIERRGRGASGDRADAYSIDRECEDVAALQAATGATLVFGHSFGGLIALEHARLSHLYTKVAVYEPGISPRTEWVEAARAQLARGRELDAFVTFARGANPAAGGTPSWLLKVILPLAIRGEERKRKQQLLPTAIREHLAAARLDGPGARYESITADVLLLTGAKRRGPDDGALARVASSTPGAALVTLPGLDHFGPEKKPQVVAPAVSAFFADQG